MANGRDIVQSLLVIDLAAITSRRSFTLFCCGVLVMSMARNLDVTEGLYNRQDIVSFAEASVRGRDVTDVYHLPA